MAQKPGSNSQQTGICTSTSSQPVPASHFLQVFWQVTGPVDENNPDMEPVSGSATIQGDRTNGEVILELLADNEPELDETFTIHLSSTEGGAEIDPVHNSTTFTIR